MPRRGRDLENLVALVEQLLDHRPVTIQSPEFFIGRNSGTEREVDVTIRAGVGSAEVMVMIECRDRSDTQGVDWIDQIVGKRSDAGADRAVVVSSSGFSAGATRAAAAVGVDLRRMSELTASEFLEWIDPSLDCVEVALRRAHLLGCSLFLADGQDDPASPVVPGAVRRTSDQVEVSHLEIWDHNLSEDVVAGAWGDLASGGRRRRVVRLNFTNAADAYEVDLSGQWFAVGAVEFDVELWVETDSALAKQFRYSADGAVISEGISFTYLHPDQGEHTVVIGSDVEDDTGGRVIRVTQRPVGSAGAP